ncbi:MAG: hypothetical protein RBR35_13295, partial [Salinivirgaceae bacterium]|nr:hypothetical protein [Salinivirgaceae bacterium]
MFEATVEYHKMALLFEMGGIEGQIKAFTDSNPLLSGPEKVQRISEIIAAAPVRFKVKGISYAGIDADDVFAKTIKDVGHQLDSLSASGIATSDIKLLDKQFEKIGKTVATRIADTMDGVPITIGDIDNLDVRGLGTVKREALKGFFTDLDDIRIGLPENLTSPKWTTYSGKILTAAGGILDAMLLASSTYTISKGTYTVQDVWNASSSIVGLTVLCSKAAGKVAGPIAVVDAARTNTEQWVKLASLLEDSRDWETTIFDPNETYLNPLQMQEFYTDMANRYVSEITLEFRALEDAVAERNLELMTARIMNLYRLRDLAREFKNNDIMGYLRNFSWTAWLGFSVTPGLVNSFDDILDPKIFDIDTIFLLYRTKLLAEEYKDAVARLAEYQTILNQHIPGSGTNTISSILYLTVPDSEAANFDVDTNQFTAKAGDKISLAYYNSMRPGGFSTFSGNVSVYLSKHSGDVCPGNVRAGECVINNDLLGQADAVTLRGDGSIDIIIPVDGRYSVRGFANRVDGVSTMGIKAPSVVRLVEAEVAITDPAPPDSDLQVIGWGTNSFSSGDFLNSSFKAIEGGIGHSLALKEDGTVVAWGDNEYGQSTIPAGLSGVKAIKAGAFHSLALKEDGTVVVWGAQSGGQNIPTGLSGIKAIAVGKFHSLTLKEDGTVVAWGENDYGQSTIPAGLSGVKAIAAGAYHSLVLKEDGTVMAWGYNDYGQSAIPAGLSGVKALAAGAYCSLALKEDGTVVAWGYNGFGQSTIPAGLSGVKAIAAGEYHSLALKEDGTVVAWGYNGYGQSTIPAGLSGVKALAAGYNHSLALKEDGTVVAWGLQSIIPSADVSGVKAIAAGKYHSLALKEDGSVAAWGKNDYGQSIIPAGLSGVKAIAAGWSCSLALKEDGTVVAWGSNYYGQNTIPTGLSGVKAIAAGGGQPSSADGGEHSLALKEDGTVVAWGYNGYGQSTVPAGLSGVKAIAAGDYHSLALKEDGTVVAWGYNDYGQSTIPAGLSGVKAIAAGKYHSLALKEDGTVVAWGYNGYGQSTFPAGLSGVKAIAAGPFHYLALKEDGTVLAWGHNGYGQSTIPAGLSGVKAIAAGENRSLALGSIIPTVPKAHFLSENLPDGSYLVGTTTKTWKFHNGDTAITDLKAVPVNGRTDSGLGITASEIVIGDVTANTDFTVSLPIAPVHAGVPIKSSYWKLVDGTGAEVRINNSRTNQFWLKLRTNLAPAFSQLQLDSVGAQVDQLVSLPVITSDNDGDALVYTASSGSVNNGQWSGSFATTGVHPVTLTVSDTIESASKIVYVVVRNEGGTARSFTDVIPDSSADFCDPLNNPGGPGLATDYADIEYLFLHGVTIGMADGANRKFEPCRYATQAEALKLLMMAAHSRHGLVFDEAARPLANLIVNDPDAGVFINASWATPYVLKAEALGIIPAADTFSPQAPATRAWLARVVTRLQSLVVPVDAFSGDTTHYQFPDRASFANDQDYNDALATAFFGYMGQLGSAFNPGDAMIRA